MTIRAALPGLLVGLLILPVAGTKPAIAGGAWSLSGGVYVTSDERERGLSLTGKDPGGGGELFWDHADGWFLGIRARRVALATGEDGELVGIIGRTGQAGAYDWAVNLAVHGLVGGEGRIFAEGSAEVSRDFGLLLAYARLAVAPDGRWLERSGFVADGRFGVEVPVPNLPDLALFGEMGAEWPGRTHPRGHWRLGGRVALGPLLLRIAYEDTTSALAIGRAGVVATLSWSF
ncbi:MAG: hypothetical protein D6740_13530 [Alphaproteobacteria bacterium]|nr:MAG: hypothetical protein D6740_13530 [Alphaproteobacteria bacterium]